MKNGAVGALLIGIIGRFTMGVGVVMVAGCAALAPPPTALYDLGPPPAVSAPDRPRLPLALAEVEVPAVLEGRAIVYRLLYAEPNRLHSYALSRWSAAPSQLVGQRLRDVLGARWTVLTAGEGAGLPRGRNQSVATLHLALDDFTHVFDAPQRSQAMVRLRATLVEATPVGDRLIAQRLFVAQQPSATADAAGGATALSKALDEVLQGVQTWIEQQL